MSLRVPRFDISEASLTSGDGLVLAAGPAFGLASLRIAVDHGSVSDAAAFAGSLDMVASMFDRGTRRRGRLELHRAFERIGASAESRVFRTSSLFDLTVLEEHLDAALDLLAEYLLEPAFDPAELDDLVQESTEEVEMQLEEPQGLLTRMTGRAIWAQPAWSRTVDGSRVTRAALTPDHLRARHAQVLAARMQFGVASERPTELSAKVVGFVERIRAAHPLRPSPAERRPTIRTGEVVAARTHAGAQSALSIVSPAPSLDHPDWDAILLHNAAFGSCFMSPLIQRIRAREGLSYGIGSSIVPDRDASLAMIQAQPQASKAAYTALACLETWQSFVESPLDPGFIERVKGYYVGSTLVRSETVRQRMAAALHLRLLGRPVSEVWEHPRRVSELSVEDVTRAATLYGPSAGNAQVVCALPRGISDAGWQRHLPGMARRGVPRRELV